MIIPIKFTIEMDYEIEDDFPLENIEWYIEEHLCKLNIVYQLIDEINKNSGKCTICDRTKIKIRKV